MEEYRAFNWSVGPHIHRIGEMSMRCIHLGDNTTQVGAHAKGRSSSRQLNHYCRQDCSIQIVGNIIPFVLWVPSARNPADEPSSKYGIRIARQAQEAARRWPPTAKPAPAASHVGDDDATPFLRPCRKVLERDAAAGPGREQEVKVYVFLHTFSGLRRPGDLHCWIQVHAYAAGCAQRGLR